MILEALITTENEDGSMHLSAIGPHVDSTLTHWELKPFVTSTTFKNLQRNNRCVIHITDDALMLAKVVTRQVEQIDNRFHPEVGYVMPNACSAIGIQLKEWSVEGPRATAIGKSTWRKEFRAFWGWNRAKHGILELAIAVTRIGIIPQEEIFAAHDLATRLVAKTGGDEEHLALKLLEEFLNGQLAATLEKR